MSEPSAQIELSEEEAAEMSSRYCKHSARMTLPLPAATLRERRMVDAMRARRIIDAMKGTELPSLISGPPSRSEEALSRVDEAEAILP